MGYRLHRFLILWLLAFVGINATGGPLDLKVVYPRPEQALPPVDSTFILGSVEPGSKLWINDTPVAVHKSGGWLTFLPVAPGRFTFNLRAEKKDRIDTLTRVVQLPPLPDYSFAQLRLYPGSMLPSETIWALPGDAIDVSCRTLPFCNVACVVEPIGDTVYLHEQPPRRYGGSRTVFDSDEGEADSISGSPFIRGEYRGRYVIPQTDFDSLLLVYYVYPPSAAQAVWLLENNPLAREEGLLPIHKIMALDAPPPETSGVAIKVLNARALPVIEFTDSLNMIRTGPGKAYLAIQQPAGIRTELTGRQGKWLKLRLSDYQSGWVPDSAVAFLPQGSLVPHSFIKRMRTTKTENGVMLHVGTTGRHPFRIDENLADRTITIYLFGAVGDVDWIRYDTRDEMIDHIVWFQSEPHTFAARIHFTTDRLWGYDAGYEGDQFYISFRRPAEGKSRVGDFRYVLDPGHSPEPGAVGPTGLTERETNLAIALALKKELEKEGAEVILTRSDTVGLPLYDRPKVAWREKADIFISIHNNALPDGINPFTNNGVSTYYYHPHSAALARAVQFRLAHRLRLNDFGLYHGNLAVIRPTQYPAILIECAFMMIPEQEARLRKPGFQRQVARAVVRGIQDFLEGQ